MSLTVNDVLPRLEGVRRTGSGWTARCPCPEHADQRASLSIGTNAAGTLLFYCHAGCEYAAIVSALGLMPTIPPRTGARQPTALSDYPDAAGHLCYQVLRYDPKDFRVRRPDGCGGWIWNLTGVQRIPYRLPELRRAAEVADTVYYVEGEKDVESARTIGLTATTLAGGAAASIPEGFADYFRGVREVILPPDNDAPGQEYARRIADVLVTAGIPCKIVALPGLAPKGDLTNWLSAGGTREQLETLVEQTTPYVAASEDELPEDPVSRSECVPPRSLRELLQDPALLQPPPALIPGLVLEKRSSLIAGREKSGKSTLTGQAAAALSRGGDFLGHPLEPTTILWYALDEPLHDAVRRLAGYRADLDRLYITDQRPESPQVLIDHIRVCGAACVFVDTLGKLWLGRVNENKADEVEEFLTPYIETTRREGAALVLLHHAGRMSGEYRGSTAIGACVDIVLTLRRRKGRKVNTGTVGHVADGNESAEEDSLDDGRRLLEGSGRGITNYQLHLSFDGQCYTVGDHPIPLPAQILTLLQTARLGTTQIREALKNAGQGRRNDAVKEALEQLASQHQVTQDDEGRWYLCPTPEHGGNEVGVTSSQGVTPGDGPGTEPERPGNERDQDRVSPFPICQTSPTELGTEGMRRVRSARLSGDAQVLLRQAEVA